MARIKRKTINGKTYYYLEHSYRTGGKISKKEVYLGKSVPKNIEKIKDRFVFEIYEQKWYFQFDRIKRGFARERGPMPSEAVKKYLESFMIRFTYDTQRIEGSTLSFRETAALLLTDTTPKNRPLHDVREAEAHRGVFYGMLSHRGDLNESLITEWHYELLKDTKPAIAGKIRDHQVYVAGSRFVPPPPVEVRLLLREFFRWYDRSKRVLHPVELAALAHLKFVTIHPFTDGNGRISRLIMNFVLNRHRYPMLDIAYVSRAGYYTALEKSQTKGADGPFLQWFFRRYLKDNEKYAR